MMSFLKNIDFLGETFNFSINKSSSFKTVSGGLLSSLIMLSYVYFFYLFGKDFFLKTNPNTYSEIRISKNTNESLVLNDKKFLFGISAYNIISNKFINISEYLYPVVKYYEKNNMSEPYSNKSFDTVPCDQLDTSHFSNSFLNLDKFLCPNMTQLKDKSIRGDIFDENSSFITLDLYFCKDAKNLSDCNLSRKIKEFESSTIIWIIYPEITYDTDNYEQPFTVNFKTAFTFLDLQLIINDNLHFMEYLLEDDIGILYESKNQTKNYGGYSMQNKHVIRKTKLFQESFNKTKMDFIGEIDNLVYTINLLYLKNTYYFTRKYMKFQDLLGNIRGFMELLIFIFAFFYQFYNKFRLDTYLFNRLIIIKDENILEKMNFSIELFEKSKRNKIKNKELNNDKKDKDDKFTHLFETDINYQIEKNNSTFENSKNEMLVKKTENSIDENNQNSIDKNNEMKERFDLIYMKLIAYKNSISFKFLEFCKYVICGKKLNNYINRDDLLNQFCDKLYFKFDIFYYLKMIKKNKILRKSILKSDQDLFLRILSKKLYNLGSFITKEKITSKENSKEIVDKIWKYYISPNNVDQNLNNNDTTMKNFYF